MTRLLTAEQLCEQYGIPGVRTVRTMRQNGLAAIRLGPVVHDGGKPLARIDKGFRQAVRRAGLEDVTPHTLRHTCATWLAQNGVAMHDIAGWLGHSDGRTTQLYAHHHPDFMNEAKRAADRRKP